MLTHSDPCVIKSVFKFLLFDSIYAETGLILMVGSAPGLGFVWDALN